MYSQTIAKVKARFSPEPLDICIATGYAVSMVTKKTAPEVVGATAGALTRPTGAEQTAIGIMAPGRAFPQGEVHGMPSLSSTC